MILVTGATGLLGAHLTLQLLKTNEKIRAIYRNEESIKKTKAFFDYKNCNHEFLKIEWIKADLNDIPALEIAFKDITFVYHCAALISFDPRDEKTLRKINIEGTANIVNLCIDFNIKKLCYVSSIATLGETLAKNNIITETTNWNPEVYHSDYAITKYGAEMEVWRATQENLKVIIINPGIIFGEGFGYEGSNDFFLKIKKDFPFYTKGIAGIVYVDDVVNAMTTLMQSDIYNQRFCIVSDNITYKELLEFIAAQLDKKTPYIYASKLGCKIAWKLDAFISFLFGKKRSFTKALAIASHSQFIYSSEKIKKQLDSSLSSYEEYLPKIIKYHQKEEFN